MVRERIQRIELHYAVDLPNTPPSDRLLLAGRAPGLAAADLAGGTRGTNSLGFPCSASITDKYSVHIVISQPIRPEGIKIIYLHTYYYCRRRRPGYTGHLAGEQEWRQPDRQ
jgi:hypothetical protein